MVTGFGDFILRGNVVELRPECLGSISLAARRSSQCGRAAGVAA